MYHASLTSRETTLADLPSRAVHIHLSGLTLYVQRVAVFPLRTTSPPRSVPPACSASRPHCPSLSLCLGDPNPSCVSSSSALRSCSSRNEWGPRFCNFFRRWFLSRLCVIVLPKFSLGFSVVHLSYSSPIRHVCTSTSGFSIQSYRSLLISEPPDYRPPFSYPKPPGLRWSLLPSFFQASAPSTLFPLVSPCPLSPLYPRFFFERSPSTSLPSPRFRIGLTSERRRSLEVTQLPLWNFGPSTFFFSNLQSYPKGLVSVHRGLTFPILLPSFLLFIIRDPLPAFFPVSSPEETPLAWTPPLK